MELNRFLRVLRDRWLFVVAIGLLSLVGAWLFTNITNSQRESQYQATIGIRFTPQQGQPFDELLDEVGSAADIASVAASDLLENDEMMDIDVDPNARLVFIAHGPTETQATEKAQQLLRAYLDVDPTVGGAVEQSLARIAEQAAELERQIDQLQPSFTPEEEELLAQHELIDQKIASMTDAVVSLTVDLASITGEERAPFQTQLDSVEAALSRLEAEKLALGPAPELEELTVDEEFQLASLLTGRDILLAQYQLLLLRQVGVTESESIDPVEILDLSAQPGNLAVNAAIGFVGGLIFAAFALIFMTRARKPIWLPEDLPIPFLADIPTRRGSAGTGDTWYDTAEGSRRKTAIQALRSAVEAELPSTAATLAITGHRVSDESVHALAVDLGVAMASAGSSVLLVDADFASTAALGEYRVGGPSLSGVLTLNPDLPEFNAEVESVVDNAYLIRPGLAVVPSGPPPASHADALAGRQFRAFIDKASQPYDFVIVAVGDISTPAAQVAMQRLRKCLLTLAPGRSTAPEVEGLLLDVQRRQVVMIGAVFVQKSERGLSRERVEQEADQIRAQPTESPAVEKSPISRLDVYPIPGERGSALAQHDSLQDLADAVNRSTGAPDAVLGNDLLSALNGAPADQAYEAVSDYLITRVDDIINVTYGRSDVSEELAHEVATKGFISLRPLTDHRTVGNWLDEEIQREVSRSTALAIVAEMERILSSRARKAVYLDEWLSAEFFRQHLARTEGEPTVLHLTSSLGTVQVLAPTARMDHQSIERLMTDVASRTIDELERYLRAAETRGDLEQADVFQNRILDVRRFDTALGQLLGVTAQPNRRRSSEPVWRWTPDWSRGTRTNLAPLQRVGLFPFAVLSEEEMTDVFAAP